MEPGQSNKENAAATLTSKKGYNQIVIIIRDGKVISFEQTVHDGSVDGADGDGV